MSSDEKGRTLFEILTGRNQRDMTPLELQYHNPLEAKVGCTVSFEHEPDIAGINFVIEKISVYETQIGPKKFYHTDYHLKGISLDVENYIRMRLRLIPDENLISELGCRVQLLHLYHEMGWDQPFYDDVLGCSSGEFWVNHDDDGTELEEPRKYWRIEDVLVPYESSLTLLYDADGDGNIDDDELEHSQVHYWDYSRLTNDENEQEITEFLTIEMDDETQYFTFLRGTDIEPSQIIIF